MKAIVLCCAVICVSKAKAAETEMHLQSPPLRQLKLQEQESPGLMYHSRGFLEQRLYDRLSPISVSMSDLRPDGKEFVDLGLLRSSFVRGARETVVTTPFVQNVIGNFRGFFRDLFEGSVANTGEKDVEPGKVVTPATEQWFDKIRERKIQYGTRLSTGAQGAYIGQRFDVDDEELFTWYIRYNFEDYAYHRPEAVIDVPLMHGWSIGSGIRYSTDPRDRERGEEIAGKFSVSRHIGKHGGLALGTEIHKKVTVVLACYTSW